LSRYTHDEFIVALSGLIGLGEKLANRTSLPESPWRDLLEFEKAFHHYIEVFSDYLTPEKRSELHTLTFRKFIAGHDLSFEDFENLSPFAAKDVYENGTPGVEDFEREEIAKAVRWLRVLRDKRRATTVLNTDSGASKAPRVTRIHADAKRADLLRLIQAIMAMPGITVRKACVELDKRGAAKPSGAKWLGSSWTEAYRLSAAAVKTWFSKANKEISGA